METISQRWAKFALELNYENIPSVALEEAKRFLLDSIGCAFSALNNKDTQSASSFSSSNTIFAASITSFPIPSPGSQAILYFAIFILPSLFSIFS
ncbi:unnamed protein product [marine sediment metagenome]|uniref:MmgE/PrpD N-terminal domain-containing protein n=1 Tax=marine sediment metagenome TaxID=412755 RepID=X1AC68_9ZZZZ